MKCPRCSARVYFGTSDDTDYFVCVRCNVKIRYPKAR